MNYLEIKKILETNKRIILYLNLRFWEVTDFIFIIYFI